MPDIRMIKSTEPEWCSSCRKMLTEPHNDLIVGIFRMPLCPECYKSLKDVVIETRNKETT